MQHRFYLEDWIEFFTKDEGGEVWGHKYYPTIYFGTGEFDNEWISDSNHMQRFHFMDEMFEPTPWEESLKTREEMIEMFGLTMVRIGDG